MDAGLGQLERITHLHSPKDVPVHVLFLYPHPPFRSGFYPVKGRHSASLPLNISSPSIQLPFPFIFSHTTAVSDSFKRNTLGSASLSSATAF
ncbi:hypothetical protein ACTHUD_26940, partial [Neisseria sp. P0016.S002]